MSQKEDTPFIATSLAKTSGYSKAIIDAINGGNGVLKSDSRQSKSSATSLETGMEVIVSEDSKSEDGEVELNSEKSVPLTARQKKALSCDLSESSYVVEEGTVLISDTKKSQSLRSVDQKANTPKRMDAVSLRSDKTTTTWTTSTISSSSKLSKENEFIEEPIPFKVCADALYACAKGDTITVKKLLKEYPHLLNYAYPHCFRLTCLHVAARCKHLPLVRYLIEQGANPNLRDNNGQTPMHLAAISNKLDIVQILRSHKADPDIADAYGLKPEDYIENDFDSKSSKTMSMLGNSINTIASISGLGGVPAMISAGCADTSWSNVSASSSNGTFQRIGSLRPLRRKVNKVRDLFN